jgi:predicted O-methyltransferase YrrM
VTESTIALVDRLLADPPAVHAMAAGPDPEIGIWSTDRDCYLLLAEHAAPGTRTLETGSGVSTILFAALGAVHTCVTPAQSEADRILAYCSSHDIATSSLTFEIGRSDEVLPRLASDDRLDVVLIDGGHGFPTPIIDWYYAASRLRSGGLLVCDDVALPAVAHLCAFVDRDPRFSSHRRTGKWIAYTRVGDGDLGQDWFEQPFYAAPPAGLAALAARAVGKFGRVVAGRRGVS